MKLQDIEIGAVYRGKTGRNRQVVSHGPDALGNRIIRWRYAEPPQSGEPDSPEISWMMARSFANWALERVR